MFLVLGFLVFLSCFCVDGVWGVVLFEFAKKQTSKETHFFEGATFHFCMTIKQTLFA